MAGRNLSISKKFVEYVVNNSKVKNKNIDELSTDDLKNLFDELIFLINNVTNGVGHEGCIILDENNNPIDVSPFVPPSVNLERIKNFRSYSDAVDEFLNNLIVNSDVSKNLD